jgi:hypothetical protein
MASVGVQVALPVAGGAASTGSSITGNTGATPGQPASTTSSTTAATITSPFALASKSSNNSAVRPVLATAPSVGLPPMPPPGEVVGCAASSNVECTASAVCDVM